MAKKKSYKTSTEKKKVDEPSLAYEKRTIKIFHSFEEQEIYEINCILKQSPAQRIKETVELILRAYGLTREQLNQRERSNKITILRRE